MNQQNRAFLITRFWEMFSLGMWDEAYKILLIIAEYDEILRGDNE